MKICKYCKKPILDNCVWNPDSEGNGYHHACLCEMEFRLRDRQIYDKGRADVLDKIRDQIKSHLRGVEITLEVLVENDPLRPKMEGAKDTLEECLEIIDRAESEEA